MTADGPSPAHLPSAARYTPNIAPCGSRSTAMRGPSGCETGSISTVPSTVVVVTAATAASPRYATVWPPDS
ncbi:hypothetical protein ADK58_07980 [Streptomyces sp. XY152]|nr:hypothetical protein ADK58_07980 [Streptomyces sp. XY152]